MSQLAPSDPDGNYVRPTSSMSSSFSSTPPPPPHHDSNINPTDRLLLFVGYACPWCHRVQLALALAQRQHDSDNEQQGKGKWSNVHVVIVQPGDNGLWRIPPSPSSSTTSPSIREEEETETETEMKMLMDVNQMSFLKDVYLHANPSYSGRFTAPLLYNHTRNQLISNESSQLLNLLLPPPPPPSSEEDLCNTIHTDINDGVYKVGFATSQQAYNLACTRLFQALDKCEALLQQTNMFLCSSNVMTKADVMLFPTVFRFDAVYAPLFRITQRSIATDYPNMARWMRRVYHSDENVKRTCGDLNMIVKHYFASLFPLNASGIVPQTRNIDLSPLP